MKCYHPVNYNGTLYPCGKCLACKRKIRMNWTLRLAIELYYCLCHGYKAYFSTLTYDNEHIPKTKLGYYTLSKRDIQLFIKRFRKLVALRKFPKTNIRYFVCGEYGPNTYRPHYHIIIYNLPYMVDVKEMTNLLDKSWKNGFIQDTKRELCIEQIQYCSQYLCKPDVMPNDFVVKPFRMMSQSISEDYINDFNNSKFHFNCDDEEQIKYIKDYLKESITENSRYRAALDVSSGKDSSCFYELVSGSVLARCHSVFGSETAEYFINREFGDDIFQLVSLLRDFLPSNLIPFLNGKPIPRYIRDRIFGAIPKFYLNIYSLIFSAFKDYELRIKLGLTEEEFIRYSEDLLRRDEERALKYYSDVCKKKLVDTYV